MTGPDEAGLLAWFRETFAARTPPRDVLDSTPSYRVGWTEIVAALRRHGYTDNVVDLRQAWAALFNRHLRAWCNRTLRAAGEKSLPREHSPRPGSF